MKIIKEIKKKREFSGLPDSIVRRAAETSEGDVKKSRALLRKYFGVFLTNRVLKGRGSSEDILKAHRSSKKRDYKNFYKEIFSEIEKVGSIIDLGAGVNGFSYVYLRRVIGDVDYIGVEAAEQLVGHMNKYFEEKGFSARAIAGDLVGVEDVLKILKKQKEPRVVFMFQIVDALENFERNFSKKFILEISEECEKIVLSLPTESLGSQRKLVVKRKWMREFLEENFKIEKDFETEGERIIIFGKKPND